MNLIFVDTISKGIREKAVPSAFDASTVAGSVPMVGGAPFHDNVVFLNDPTVAYNGNGPLVSDSVGPTSKVKKKKHEKTSKTMKAKDMPGNCGDKEIEELLSFIESENKARRKKGAHRNDMKNDNRGTIKSAVTLLKDENSKREEIVVAETKGHLLEMTGCQNNNKLSDNVCEIASQKINNLSYKEPEIYEEGAVVRDNANKLKTVVGTCAVKTTTKQTNQSSKTSHISNKMSNNGDDELSSEADSGIAVVPSVVTEDDFTTVVGSKKRSRKKKQLVVSQARSCASQSRPCVPQSRSSATVYVNRATVDKNVPTIDNVNQFQGTVTTRDDSPVFPLLSNDLRWQCNNQHVPEDSADDEDDDVLARSTKSLTTVTKFPKSFAAVAACANTSLPHNVEHICSSSSSELLSCGASSAPHSKDLSSCNISETSSIAETSVTEGSFVCNDDDIFRIPPSSIIPLTQSSLNVPIHTMSSHSNSSHQLLTEQTQAVHNKSVVEFIDGKKEADLLGEVTFGFDINETLMLLSGSSRIKQFRDSSTSPICIDCQFSVLEESNMISQGAEVESWVSNSESTVPPKLDVVDCRIETCKVVSDLSTKLQQSDGFNSVSNQDLLPRLSTSNLTFNYDQIVSYLRRGRFLFEQSFISCDVDSCIRSDVFLLIFEFVFIY